jgi:hypothetical protein
VPPCNIDQRSPTFRALLEKYKKAGFPHIEDDVKEALAAIAQDYRNAKHGASIPRFENKVFKYRQKSTDQRRGAQSGFRIIGYYDKETNTLYPIFIYPKSERSDIDAETIKELVEELLSSIDPPQSEINF